MFIVAVDGIYKDSNAARGYTQPYLIVVMTNKLSDFQGLFFALNFFNNISSTTHFLHLKKFKNFSFVQLIGFGVRIDWRVLERIQPKQGNIESKHRGMEPIHHFKSYISFRVK